MCMMLVCMLPTDCVTAWRAAQVQSPPQAPAVAMHSAEAQLLSTQQRLSWQPRALTRQDSSSSSSTGGSAQSISACAAGGAAASVQDLTHANDLVNRLLGLLAENQEQQQEQRPAHGEAVVHVVPPTITASAAGDARSVACQTAACPSQGDVAAAAASSRAAAYADATHSLDGSRALVEELLLSLQQLGESQQQSAAAAVSTAECQTAPCQAEAFAATAVSAQSRAAAYADAHSALAGSRALVEQLLLLLGKPDAVGAVQVPDDAAAQAQLALSGDAPGLLPAGTLQQAQGLSRASSSCSSSSLSTCSSLRCVRSLAAVTAPAHENSTEGVLMSPPAPPASLHDEGAAAVSAARDVPRMSFPLYGLAGNTDEQQSAAALSPASSSSSSSSLSTCSSLSFLRAAAEPAEQTSVAAAETVAVMAEAPVETASRKAGADATPELSAIFTAAAAEVVTIAATSSYSSPRQSGDLPASAAGAQLAPLHTDLPTCLNAAASSWLHSAQLVEHLTAAVCAAVGAVAADAVGGSPGSRTSSPRSGDSTPEQTPMGSSLNRAPPTQRGAVAAVGALADCSSLSGHVEAAPAEAPTITHVSPPLPAAAYPASEMPPSQLWAAIATPAPHSNSSLVIGGAEPLAFSDGDGHCTAAVSAAVVADASAGVASTGVAAAGSRIDSPGSGNVIATCAGDAGDDAAAQDLGACSGECRMRARAGGVDVRRAVTVAVCCSSMFSQTCHC